MTVLNGAMVGRTMEDGKLSFTLLFYAMLEDGKQEKTIFPYGFASPELLMETLERCLKICKTQQDIYVVNKKETGYDLVPNPLYVEAVDERK